MINKNGRRQSAGDHFLNLESEFYTIIFSNKAAISSGVIT